ncbi:MAG TPA: DM13 domain-containing protein [Acidimicrobiales bacterium]|nr:DM13 domain-containing protein [Acidimicrobiales bacterium]
MRLPGGLRWWELVPEAVLAAGLGLFAATEPSAAGSAFKSSTAIALMVAAAVAWVLVRLVLLRFAPWRGPRTGVFLVAAVAVLAIVVLPAYDNTTVVEALPVADVDPSPAADTTTSMPTVTPPAASPAEDTITTASPTTTVPPQPVAVRSSPLHGIDHRASGSAVVYRQPDGSQVVGLEDIDIQPGPDYDVYVVPGADRESLGDAVRLDDLRGNKGTQYYEVPPGTDLTTGPWTVLVWCETFDVPVAGATPA